jgi:hypothetical protein
LRRPFSQISASFRAVLLVLIAVDLALIGLNFAAFILQSAHVIPSVPDLLKVTRDWSLPEDYNYLKWAVIVVALVWIAVRDRWLSPLPWALVFLMILIDDSLQVHESLGEILSVNLQLSDALFLFGNDLGEILVFLAMGAIALILTLRLLTRNGQDAARMSARYLLVLAGLGFFGVGIDALHQVVSHILDAETPAVFVLRIFGLLEDGGEMLVASYAVALTLAPPAHMRVDRLADRMSGRSSQVKDQKRL